MTTVETGCKHEALREEIMRLVSERPLTGKQITNKLREAQYQGYAYWICTDVRGAIRNLRKHGRIEKVMLGAKAFWRPA